MKKIQTLLNKKPWLWFIGVYLLSISAFGIVSFGLNWLVPGP